MASREVIEKFNVYKYRLESKYPKSYQHLEEALEIYAEEHELTGMKYNEIATRIIEWCHSTFEYLPNNECIIHFLQGLGLSIPYTYYDIFQLAYKEGRLLETDSGNKHQHFADNYWNFMSMRLRNIAESKK